MSSTVLATALRLADQQLAAAEAGAFDALVAGLPDYEAACALVVAEQLSADDEGALRSLISLNARIGTYVGAAALDAAGQIRRLQSGRSLAGAYLATSATSMTADARV